MENKVIAKTLLSIWPGLADYETMLKSRAHTHALCSFNTPLLTERIMDKIIDLNVKQQTIHNLRTGLERLIKQLPPVTQKVLRTHYRNFEITDHTQNLAAHLKLSERSYFRQLAAGITAIADRLPNLGINFFTWQYLLQHHRWIKEAFVREFNPHHRRSGNHRTITVR